MKQMIRFKSKGKSPVGAIMVKKIIACIMAFSFTLINVSGAEKEEYIFSETFNGIVTNKEPESVEIKGTFSRVIESGSNKLLQLMGSENETTASVKFGTPAQKYIVSMDISADAPVNGKIGFKSGNTDIVFFSVENNVIVTKEGKRVTGLSSAKFVNLSLLINRRKSKFSIYIDNKCVLSNWNLPANLSYDTFYLLTNMTESIYMDNLLIYEGNEPVKQSISPPLNPEAVEFLPIVDDLGDFTFFNSNYITHRYTAYPNTTLYPKTNEIITEKFDHYNVDKGDRIILRKSTAEDCYFDVTTKIFTTYRSDKTYKHYTIAADLMADMNGSANTHAFVLRDTQTTGTQQNIISSVVNLDGSVTLLNGKTIYGIASKDQWFNIRLYLNLAESKMDIFVNGKLEGEAIPIANTFSALNLVRLVYRSGDGSGEIQVRNMEVTGLAQPFNGEEIKTSMFSSEDLEIKDYLADKTAFHFYGENIYKNGEKQLMTVKPVYDNDELYISADDFNNAFDTQINFTDTIAELGGSRINLEKGTINQDNILLVPVKEVCENLLGKYTVDDKVGMLLVCDKKMYFDVDAEIPYHKRAIITGYIDRFSDLQYLNDFLLFDRPSRETLLEGFNEATDNGSVHPRVLATKEDFDAIKENMKTDSYLNSLVTDLIAQADRDLIVDPIAYRFQDNLRLLTQGDSLRNKMMRLGFAYQMTGDQKYADAAWNNLSQLSKFPDINPGHPIDAGSFSNGMAIGYDWMYDGFTEEQRQVIVDNAFRLSINIMNNGFYGRSPIRGGPDGNINVVGYYNKWISNYNTWVNHGTMMAAVAFMEHNPEVCTDLLWHSLRSSEYTLKNFYPDGAWVESTNYWDIGAGYMAYEIVLLEKLYGSSFNLPKFPGFSQTGLFMASMRGPLGSYNYHDAGESSGLTKFPFSFFGKYFDQPELLAARKISITGEVQGSVKESPHVFDVLLYSPDVDIEDVKKLPRTRVTRGLESYSVRGDYMDYKALFFAAHAGPVSWYHSHNDNGDFVFDLLGKRWAMALAAEDYNSSLPASEKYRVRPEGHNTVTINDGSTLNQLSNTYAPLIKAEEGEGGAFCVYDMAPMYADASHYYRGFYIDDDFKSLTVRDEIEVTKPSEIYWFMHTTAQAVVTDDNTVLLSNGGESVTLTFTSSADVSEISVMDAVPLPSTPQGKGQNGNVGVRKVAIRLEVNKSVDLAVKISEFNSQPDSTPISEWVVPEWKGIQAEDFGFELNVNNEVLESSYIPVDDLNEMPVMEFKANDENKHIETDIPTDMKKSVTVKVYSADRKMFKTYAVPFVVLQRFKSEQYEILDIVDFQVSAEPEAANVGANMFDDNFNTRWTTLSVGETAVFDLGEAKDINALAAGFWMGNVRSYKFELLHSADGFNYTLIDTFNSSGLSEEYQVFSFNKVNARYIKLIGHGNTVNVNTNILELKLLMEKAGGQ